MGDETFSFKKAEDSSGFLLWQVTALWKRGIKKALEPHDLTHAQYVLLASILWLSKSSANVTQVQLSIHSKIDPMTVSTVMKTLQKKGFIKRGDHITDTRAKIVSVTAKGTKVTKDAIKAIEQFDHRFFSYLDNDQQNFNRQLIKLISAASF
jgi:DNA-binding MarR family transcriptional regulator